MIENVLEVRISNEIFGIDADKILHILRIPPITPVVMVDKSIKGIAVILGKIVSVIDVSVLLDFNECDTQNENSRILTVSNDSSLLVDEVLDMVNINSENFEESNEDMILGLYRNNGKIVQVLDVEKLIQNIDKLSFTPKKIESISDSNKIEEKKDNEMIRCLFFKLGNEQFCMDISIIQEIIFIPNITPNTNEDELGMITLRDEILSIIDMKKLFDFKENKITEKSRAIIVKDIGLLALLIDEIEEVRDIELSMIEEISNEKFEGIFKGEILSSLLSNVYIKNLIQNHNKNDDKHKEIIKRDNDMIEVVVFKIDEEEFAFEINNVQEIIKYEKATFFPQASNFVEGLLNLRGNVIPIISLPKKLGFKEMISEKTKIIVCNIHDDKIGFIVDDVSDIMFIEDIYLSKVENENSMFDEVINLEERVIFNIQIEKIFTENELDEVKLTKVKHNG